MSKQTVAIGGGAVLAIAGLILAYYLYTKAKCAAGAVITAVGNFDNNLAGALVPDAFAGTQSQMQAFMAAWHAAGSPPTGSPAELALRAKYGIAPPPASQIPAPTVGAGSSQGS